MTDPSPNRRSAIDAGILQTETLRGYDVTLNTETPCDLIISPGLSFADFSTSNIYVWNRTDEIKPIFSFRAGSVFDTAPNFATFAGALPDPNGVVTADAGSLYISNNPPALWQNTVEGGGDAWKKISDDLGGENLQETLEIGNTSGPNDIILSKILAGPITAARLLGEDTSDGSNGGNLLLSAGSASGVTGNGGDVLLTSGNSLSGNTGNFLAGSFNSTNGNSGFASIGSGISSVGSSGTVVFFSGSSNLDSGDISLITGNSTTGTAGNIDIFGGNGATGGGGVRLFSGTPSAGNVIGAPIIALAGSGSGTANGGSITLQGGSGGPGGGNGGSLFLTAGQGGGGASKGQIVGDGNFSSDNIKFGNGNPNSLGISAEEGTLFQRTSPGVGEAWINTNGSSLGWQKLAFAADFINSFSRLQFGSVTPALRNAGGPEDDFADTLLYEGVFPHSIGAGTQARTVDSFGPVISFTTANNVDEAGWSIPANTTAIRREHRFVAVFKIANTTDVTTQRISVGLSTAAIGPMLGADEPGGQYVTLTKKDTANSWSFLTRGPGGPLSQGLFSINLSLNQISYIVFDFTDVNVCKFQFLDEDFTILEERTATGVFIPNLGANLYPVCGIRQTGVTPVGLKFYVANVIVEADQILNGGAAFANQTLQQVLQAGNETGGRSIFITEGDLIIGETDAKAPGGGDVFVFSGTVTTNVGDTGTLRLFSSSNGIPGASGNTGLVFLSSGDILDAASTGDTGTVSILSGQNLGLGNTGNVRITSGIPAQGGQSGDVRISTHFGVPQNCIPGTVEIVGGSTTLAGNDGGSVIITSGNADTPSGGDGGPLTFVSGNGDSLVASQGGLISIRTGIGGVGGQSGDLDISTGDSVNLSGTLELQTGEAPTAGEISLQVGNSTVSQGSDLNLSSGDGAVDKGGDINIIPGVGAGVPGFLVLGGFVQKDSPAVKHGSVSLAGLMTNASGFLSLTWGVAPLDSYSPFAFGTETTSLVSYFDPGLFLDVKVSTQNVVTLDLVFYDSTGTPVNNLAFPPESVLRFMTLVQ